MPKRINIKKMSEKTNISIEEIQNALGTNAPSLSLQKQLDKANTIEEIEAVYDETPDGSDIRKEALKKWEGVYKGQLDKANTIEEIKAVYNATPGGSDIQKEALKKWLDKANTIEEIKAVYNATPGGSDIEKEAIRKLAKFFQEE